MNSLDAALINERLIQTIEVHKQDKLLVDAQKALEYCLNEIHKCHVTISELYLKVGSLESSLASSREAGDVYNEKIAELKEQIIMNYMTYGEKEE